jgi:hypothetical protein
MKLTAAFFSVMVSALVLPLSVSAHETGAEHKHFFVDGKGEKQLDASNGEVEPPSGMTQGFTSFSGGGKRCVSSWSCGQ